MTRLSDALDRANEPLTGDRVRRDVPPPGWTFDAGDSPTRPPEPIAAPAVEPPRALQSQFLELAARFPEDERRTIVVGPEANDAVVEQYRRLAAALHHAQVERRARSVMIASAVPGEGKTLTSTNLALTLSQSYQRRVLLIDADLRRPSIHTMFGLPNDTGLLDCLTQPNGGRLPVQAVSPTLWVLTAGRPSPDPMGVLVSAGMRELLTQAMETFDWVVVDTPPVAILSDAHLLAGMIDTAILVVGARSAPYPIVQRAATAIGTSKILGVVLNRTERRELSDGYGYYANRGRYGRAPQPSRWRQWLPKRAS